MICWCLFWCLYCILVLSIFQIDKQQKKHEKSTRKSAIEWKKTRNTQSNQRGREKSLNCSLCAFNSARQKYPQDLNLRNPPRESFPTKKHASADWRWSPNGRRSSQTKSIAVTSVTSRNSPVWSVDNATLLPIENNTGSKREDPKCCKPIIKYTIWINAFQFFLGIEKLGVGNQENLICLCSSDFCLKKWKAVTGRCRYWAALKPQASRDTCKWLR